MIGVYRVFLVCLGVFCLSCFGATAKSMDSNLGKRKHPNNGYQIQSTKFKSDFSPIARKSVAFPSKYSAGTIVIRTSERRLYHVTAEGRALAYGIGVGKTGFTWSGSNKISRKAEWPGWTPPARMRAREAKKGRILPAYMPGGPNNPLGARALYIGSTIYRIHGTNQPWTIGHAMSSGCIRMANDDVKHLYANVGVGTRVVVLR
ncbi:lipoprotein-anchoring transpeptidase ErfK/SrfK [Phyllobacterium ifriqiyense]|uniref:Lipoprotein-anchoring transpeptidase ErfK/SrfK n=1 Tax=Phyllobacterium ifriqiyense TaxID=314238 RepID=A0ABU0SFA3_9HYPH|nr:L,D-transpeptidase [Phyllobacterium ifriqiyense]MDQ0999452.1 lipoprotein-anchoring transpeptidase ErfK/SrfK [Phyllobacterium ifriqiyense]